MVNWPEIPLGVTDNCANSVAFWGSVPVLPHLCPLSVPEVQVCGVYLESHEEHHILSTAEAISFASQFWDRKVRPMKASKQEFLATCIDIDLEKNVKHAHLDLFACN